MTQKSIGFNTTHENGATYINVDVGHSTFGFKLEDSVRIAETILNFIGSDNLEDFVGPYDDIRMILDDTNMMSERGILFFKDIRLSTPLPSLAVIASGIMTACRREKDSLRYSYTKVSSEEMESLAFGGITPNDRSNHDIIRSIFEDYGGSGLSIEEITQLGEVQNISETETLRAVKQLHDAGELYKIGNVYKRL